MNGGVRTSRLSLQVTPYLAAALALAFGLLGWMNVQKESARAEGELKAAARDRSTIMALSLAPLLAGYSYTTVELVANAAAQQAGVVRIEVVNARGKTVAMASAPGSPAGTIGAARDVVFDGAVVGAVKLELASDSLAARKADIVLDTARTGISAFVLLWLALRAVLEWRVLAPVRRLREMVRRIASDPGHIPAHELPCSGAHEVAELVHVFHDMKKQLAGAYAKLEDKVSVADGALRAANAELQHRARQLEEALMEVETLSVTDPLTRVANRRGFEEALHRGFSEAVRYGEPSSMLLVDVDHFKAINDTHGHLAGDRALVAVAAALRESVRSCDTVGRVGGDEFAVLLPRTDAAEAQALCRRLFEHVNAVRIAHESGTIAISVSIGLATTGAETPKPERLVGKADSALYEAKRRGRAAWATFASDVPANDFAGERLGA